MLLSSFPGRHWKQPPILLADISCQQTAIDEYNLAIEANLDSTAS